MLQGTYGGPIVAAGRCIRRPLPQWKLSFVPFSPRPTEVSSLNVEQGFPLLLHPRQADETSNPSKDEGVGWFWLNLTRVATMEGEKQGLWM